jgi:hypothetical protein
VRAFDESGLVGGGRVLLELVELAAYEPLHRSDRVVGVRDRLSLGRVAHQALARGRERDD